MGLSQDAKQELCALAEPADCCRLAELSAILHAAGSLLRTSRGTAIEIVTRFDIRQPVERTLNAFFCCGIDETVEFTPLGENFVLKLDPSISQSVLTDCGLISYDESGAHLCFGIDKHLIMDDCCKAAFVRGAFLGAGSLSDKSGYHLEFVAASYEFAKGLRLLIEDFDIKAGLSERRKRHIVYIKGSDNIHDILSLMGARNSAERFSEVVRQRSLSQDAARGSNCFQANLDKSYRASALQLHAIEKLKESGKLALLSDKLRQTAAIRLQRREATYEELSAALGISKNALCARLNKIVEQAKKL